MKIISRTATIDSGESKSATVSLGEQYQPGIYQVLAMQMPAAWTAASVSFEVSSDGDTFVPLYWNNDSYIITALGGADASSGVALEPSAFAGWPYIKVVSGVDGSLVNQAAEREIKLLMGTL